MAVMPMAKVSIYGMRSERKKILEALQRMGVVDVSDVDGEKVLLEKQDTASSVARFNKARTDAEKALAVIGAYSPEKKSPFAFLEGKAEVSDREYGEYILRRDEIMGYVSGILKSEKEISDLKNERIKLETTKTALLPWKDLQVPLNYKGTKKAAAFIGTFPEVRTAESLAEEFDRLCDEHEKPRLRGCVHIEVVSERETQVCALVLCARVNAAETEELLRHMGFAAPQVSCDVLPSKRIAEIECSVRRTEEQTEKCRETIKGYAAKRTDIKVIADYFGMRADKYKVIARLGQSRKTFMLEGYMPEKDAARVEKEITDKYKAAFEWEKSEDDDTPVILENNGFAAPLEGVLETFSLPGKGEVDPTSVMALFYYFLFGLMLSDAAYGLIMVLVCGIALLKFPKMESGMKKSLKMFLYCGVSTTFWGVMFGGYFGDAVSVVSSTFFGREVTIPPLWFAPINDPMRMLVFSFAVGIVHLFTGLGMKMYTLIRDKKYKEAIYDVVFWYLLVGGAIVFLLSTEKFASMTGLSFVLPAAVGRGAAIAAGIGAVGIVLTAGRSSSNPFKRLAKGLYELYNVTGYLSDILSYSRLLALGLATGVIANVFNKMGSMMGGGVLGAVLFTVIFVIGHTMNIGINLLGAYVHTNRLQFVEFFGKFYEGGGRKFSPFRAETRYFEPESK